MTPTVHGKCLVKMEKAFHLWMEAVNRKCVPAEGNILNQNTMSLCEDVSKGSPEMSDTKSFTASMELLH